MSNAYLGRSARSLNQSVYSGYSTGTAASQGRIVRRTPAPRFHPCIIIVAVVCIGMVIVGLVMTVIANWPGYSPTGFNVLEIVGPVILGVGVLALICTIAVVVMRNRYQKEDWERKMIDAERSRAIWASRTTIGSTGPQGQGSIGRPSKSILKKTPSTSTYGRDSNVFDEGSDSGVAAYTPNHVNNSYEPESDTSDTQKPHHVYKIETMPDPPAARYGGRHGSNHTQPYHNHSTDSESHVPVPIRVPKSKKTRSQPSQPQYAQEAYATQPPAVRGSPLVGTPDIGGMSDRLSYTSDQEIVAMPSTPTSYQLPQPKPHRTMQDYEPHERSYDAFDPNAGHHQQGFQPPIGGYEQPAGPQGDAAPRHKSRNRSRDEAEPQAEDIDRNTEARRSRRKKKKKPVEGSTAEGTQDGTGVEYAKPRKHKKRTHAPPAGAAVAAPLQQSSPTLTRINIHAQPGTSVSITPGGPQYQAPLHHNVSKEGSVETEI